MSDAIVPPHVAKWVFPSTEQVDGDHFSIIRPDSLRSACYQVLSQAIMVAASSADTTRRPPVDASFAERLAGVSVAPPYGERHAPLRGRDNLIASIQRTSENYRVHVLAGLGGSGKSRLALELAHRAERSGKQVWWVRMNRVNSSMREVANQLGVPESQAEMAWRGAGSATDLLWRYLSDKADPWMLVFDNADEPEQLGPLNGPVSDGTGWLRNPPAPRGTVIVTSRDRNDATWGPWSFVHPVHPLPDDDGAQMLLDLVGEAGGKLSAGQRAFR